MLQRGRSGRPRGPRRRRCPASGASCAWSDWVSAAAAMPRRTSLPRASWPAAGRRSRGCRMATAPAGPRDRSAAAEGPIRMPPDSRPCGRRRASRMPAMPPRRRPQRRSRPDQSVRHAAAASASELAAARCRPQRRRPRPPTRSSRRQRVATTAVTAPAASVPDADVEEHRVGAALAALALEMPRKMKAPRNPGRSLRSIGSSRAVRRPSPRPPWPCHAVADRDLARLLGLGDLAHEVDVQETVLERRALHLDVVGELEHALEGARGDALVERLALVLVGLGLLLAADRQRVFLDLDVELGLARSRPPLR